MALAGAMGPAEVSVDLMLECRQRTAEESSRAVREPARAPSFDLPGPPDQLHGGVPVGPTAGNGSGGVRD